MTRASDRDKKEWMAQDPIPSPALHDDPDLAAEGPPC